MRKIPHSLLVIGAGAAAGLILGIAIACGGGDDDDATAVPFGQETSEQSTRDDPATATETATPPEDTATAEPPPTDEPTSPDPTQEPVETGDNLPCGDILVPINKSNSLSSDCWPGDIVPLAAHMNYGGDQSLRQEAALALNDMFDAAAADGYELLVSSSFRSYDLQVSTYQYWVDTLGQAEADRISARPGHSEHQLGTTVDLTSASAGYLVDEVFGTTAEGQWVAAHSWEYGFIISYPAGTEGITGYAYEPWHIRYVGQGVAADVFNSGLTLHEFLMARAGG